MKDSNLLFCPDGTKEWMHSHASQPFAHFVDRDICRVYFSSRNKLQQSSIGSVDITVKGSFTALSTAKEAVLSPGLPGLFDDSGTSMGCVVAFGGQTFLYYLGWNLRVTVPWSNTIGLAILDPTTGQFTKWSTVPVMDRSEEDPFSMSYPFVLNENGILRMWYGSNLRWGKSTGDMEHAIRYAESMDGIHWKRAKEPLIKPDTLTEIGIARPVIINNGGGYRMWFSIRHLAGDRAYDIGYAESADGYSWKRMNPVQPITSQGEWDSDMMCYPHVFDFEDSLYMLYNGNGYGKTGFGIMKIV